MKKEENKIKNCLQGLQQAVNIVDEIKKYILELEKAQKVYWDKMYKSTDEDTENFYRGMEHSVLACINDLKNIVGDKNESFERKGLI